MALPNRAVGFIIFRRLERQIEYLLLKASNGGHWSPPKGHVEEGEDDMSTAYRETREEAGFAASDLKVFAGFRKELSYVAWEKPKVTVLYLAELRDSARSVCVSDEHTSHCWNTLEPACELAQFADLQAVLRDAESFIKSPNAASDF